MKITTLLNCDTAIIIDNYINFVFNNRCKKYSIAEIVKLEIFTTDKGPFVDDVALAVFIKNKIFVIPSEHQCYKSLIFDELPKVISINFEMIIKASTCCENSTFVIYEKGISKIKE